MLPSSYQVLPVTQPLPPSHVLADHLPRPVGGNVTAKAGVIQWVRGDISGLEFAATAGGAGATEKCRTLSETHTAWLGLGP